MSTSYAPGNDPFVITVGALDQHMTADPSDDTAPSWSANGQTMDGFHKFVSTDPLTGSRVFDAASWNAHVAVDGSWAQASWAEASWAEANWNAASWNASVDSMMTTLASYSESTFAP